MWVWIIVIAVLVCICAAVADANDSQEKNLAATLEQQKQETQANQARIESDRREQFAAKRPEALAQLLKEEFPQHKDDFTYGRCQRMLTWYTDRGQEAARTAKNKEPDRADRLMGMLFAREIATIFSAAFATLSEAEPANTWSTIVMCIEASELRAQT